MKVHELIVYLRALPSESTVLLEVSDSDWADINSILQPVNEDYVVLIGEN